MNICADDWHRLSLGLCDQFSLHERLALAWSVLRTLPPQQVIEVATTVLPKGAGQPIPPLFNHMDEASFWSDLADPGELDAYCLASFNRMSPDRQAAFLDYVQRGQVA